MRDTENTEIHSIFIKNISPALRKENCKHHHFYTSGKVRRLRISLPSFHPINNFEKSFNLEKSIISFPLLRQVWRDDSISGVNPFRQLMIINMLYMTHKGFCPDNWVTPYGLFIDLVDTEICKDEFYIAFIIDDELTITLPAVLHVFFCFNQTGAVHTITIKVVESIDEQYFAEVIPLTKKIISALRSDPHPVCLVSMVSSNPDKRERYFTSTGSIQL